MLRFVAQKLPLKKTQCKMSRYTLPVIEDPDTGDLMIEFTEEVLQELDWGAGTVLEWTDNEDGTWTLAKRVDDE